MSTMFVGQSELLISGTAYYATTGVFFGVAVVAAASRAYIRIFHLKLIHADDYLFLLAVAALVAGNGLFYAFIGILYRLQAIAEGKALPSPDLLHDIENAATYALFAQLLCWTAILSVKLSFLLYFRALVNRLYKMEAWWWFILVVFIPIAAVMIPGPFIVCPHVGLSALSKCSASPGFLQREHNFLYFTVTADIVTDAMLISIPVIVLRKSSFNLGRKVSIAFVLCLSLLMIAIALVRGISAGVLGTQHQAWNSFWVQLEASVSVIAACPTAFRSLFLVNKTSKNTPEKDNQGQRSAFERLWKRSKPSLQSIRVGATLTGMRTMIRGNGSMELGSRDEEYALSPSPSQVSYMNRKKEVLNPGKASNRPGQARSARHDWDQVQPRLGVIANQRHD